MLYCCASAEMTDNTVREGAREISPQPLDGEPYTAYHTAGGRWHERQKIAAEVICSDFLHDIKCQRHTISSDENKDEDM